MIRERPGLRPRRLSSSSDRLHMAVSGRLHRVPSSSVLRRAVLVAALMILAARWAQIVGTGVELDAGAYWSAELSNLYAAAEVGAPRAYLYSPAFAQAIAVIAWLPWPLFHGAWTLILILALVWILGPVGAGFATLLPPVYDELLVGNISLLIAASIVLSFRHPAAWAFPLLTKVTPGIGMVWYAFRRDWRGLRRAVGWTAAIVVVSFAVTLLFDVRSWWSWFSALGANADGATKVNLIPLPLPLRLLIASAIIAVAAATGRRWLVPFGVLVSLPVVWYPSLSVLVAAWPLLRHQQATPPIARHRTIHPTPAAPLAG